MQNKTKVIRGVKLVNFIEYFKNANIDFGIFTSFGITDALDIAIVAFIFYKFLMLVKETRAEQLIKGMIILLVALKLSEWANLVMIHFILQQTMTLGFLALLIVFQPELRRGLEYIGRSKFLAKSLVEILNEEQESSFDEIVNAVSIMSRSKIGGLIVLEKDSGLNDLAGTGIRLDARVSSNLIQNVFFPNSPLHDGAVIIKRDRIVSAGCILPLSDSVSLSKDLGTRHRAALGLVETTDALVVIVSEETGAVSVAMKGKLSRFLDGNTLKSILKAYFVTSNKKPGSEFLKIWRHRNDESV